MALNMLVLELFEAARAGGSKITKDDFNPVEPFELGTFEGETGGVLIPELRMLVEEFGGGLRDSISDEEREIDYCVIPSFDFTKLKLARQILGSPSHVGQWQSTLRKRQPKAELVFPWLFNGVDWVLLCQATDGSTGVSVCRSGFGIASENWKSIEAFLEFHIRCWRTGIYSLDHSLGGVDFDGLAMEELLRDFQSQLGRVGTEPW